MVRYVDELSTCLREHGYQVRIAYITSSKLLKEEMDGLRGLLDSEFYKSPYVVQLPNS